MRGDELKKKEKFELKKRQRFQKIHHRGHRSRARARINITPQTYETKEVSMKTFIKSMSHCLNLLFR